MDSPAYCEHCGARLTEGQRFCEECGQQVAPAAAPPTSQPELATAHAAGAWAEAAVATPGRRSGVLIVGAALLMLVLGSLIAVFVVLPKLRGGGASTPAQPPPGAEIESAQPAGAAQVVTATVTATLTPSPTPTLTMTPTMTPSATTTATLTPTTTRQPTDPPPPPPTEEPPPPPPPAPTEAPPPPLAPTEAPPPPPPPERPTPTPPFAST